MSKEGVIMLPGVKLVTLDWKIDDRGYLAQVFHSADKLFPEAKRIYVVGNFERGMIRAFHGHKQESKYFFVLNGSVRFVLVGMNLENPKIESYVISARKPQVLVVPPGTYNGWQSLEENTLLLAISDKTLEESLNDDFRLDPLHFGKDVWKTKPR